MKRTVRVKLRTSPEQKATLKATLEMANAGANLASEVAFAENIKGKQSLQRRVYGELKALGLSAQPSLLAIHKVAGAYATMKSNLRAGNLGKKGGKRWLKATGKPIRFREMAAQPFDDRCLSWQVNARTVSIWTVAGRLPGIGFVGREADINALEFRKGQSDLIEHEGEFYLSATIDEEAPPMMEVEYFLGIDMGIANIASTSDGINFSGKTLNRVRHKNRALRTKLQKKNTKSTKRLLRKRSGKEARFAKDVNHQISKKIVTEAQRTGRGIAIEDLTGIRDRVRLRKPQRVTLNSWSFAQLGQFLTYKADRAGIPLVMVDPAYTSQQCSECGYIDKKNRQNQADFCCRSCGVLLHADINASINIAQRGRDAWAAVNPPNVIAA